MGLYERPSDAGEYLVNELGDLTSVVCREMAAMRVAILAAAIYRDNRGEMMTSISEAIKYNEILERKLEEKRA